MSETGLVSRMATAAWLKLHPGVTLSHPDRENPHIELKLREVPRLGIDKLNASRARRRAGPAETPWMPQQAVDLLTTLLRPTDQGLEFGAGGSTIWFARHCAFVRSIDAFAHWHDPLAARIKQLHIDNVELLLVSADELGYESDAHKKAYVNAFAELPNESQDWVLVDGEYRDQTAMRALDLLKPGGLLVVDDAHHFLPTESRSRWKVSKPASPLWEEFSESVRGWRHIWTSNGVSDTALWIKR